MTTPPLLTPHEWWRDIGSLTVLILAVACGIWPLWAPGWPFNHEMLYFAQRTGVFAAHLSQGDWLPLWASSDNLGFGSPQPILYHKLFSYVSGVAYWLGNDMKLALMLATSFFLFSGASGMFFLLRTLGVGRSSALAGGICLIFANYTATNWLVRGALAEFSGAMLTPWVIAFFLRVLHRERHTKDAIALAFTLNLLFWAHSLLAYFLVLLLPIIAGTLWSAWGLRLERGLIYRLILATVLCLFMLAPILFAMHQLSQGYDLSRILPLKYLPENQLKPFSHYFWDTYLFGRDFRAYTVRLDAFPLAVALLGGGWLLWRRIHAPEVWALLLTVAVILLLQTRAGVWVYKLLPGGSYIQFPWRLLAVATPCLIAAALLVLRSITLSAGCNERGVAATAFAIAALCMIISGPFSRLAYGRYSPQDVDSWGAGPILFSLFGEYLPRTVPRASNPLPLTLIWAEQQHCQIREERDPGIFESLNRNFEVECANKAILALPLFGSPYHRLTVNGLLSSCQDLPELPGLCALPVPAGRSSVVVRMPTFRALLKTNFKRALTSLK